MGNGIIGKIIYFWIFVLGGLFFARIFRLVTESKDMIILLIVLSCIYWGLTIVRGVGKNRKGQ